MSKPNTKKCTYCDEEVSVDARRCIYCGSLLDNRAYELKRDSFSHSQTDEGEIQIQDVRDESADKNAKVDEPPSVMDKADRALEVAKESSESAESPGKSTSGQDQDLAMGEKPLSNGIKVLLTVLTCLLPGVGQIIGLISAIVFINTEEPDRKSFGVALLVVSLVLFMLVCFICYILSLAFSPVKS